MADCLSTIVGRVYCSLPLGVLASQLAAAGLRVEVKERLCSPRDDYILIDEGDDFTLQADILGGYQVDGLSTSVEEMYAAASRVSSSLTELGIKHRFEVRDSQSRLVQYLHHLWPQVDEQALGHHPGSSTLRERSDAVGK